MKYTHSFNAVTSRPVEPVTVTGYGGHRQTSCLPEKLVSQQDSDTNHPSRLGRDRGL